MSAPTPWPALPPDGAPKAVELVADALHAVFKGDTDVDCDLLAADIIDALMDDALSAELRWYDGDRRLPCYRSGEGAYVVNRLRDRSDRLAGAGQAPPVNVDPSGDRVVDLMAALEQSIADAKAARRRHPQPPTEAPR